MFGIQKGLFQILRERLRSKAIKQNQPKSQRQKIKKQEIIEEPKLQRQRVKIQKFETFTEDEFDIVIQNLLLTIPWVEKLIENHDFTTLNQSRVLRTSNPIFKGKPLHFDIENYISIDDDHDFYYSEDYVLVLNQIIELRKNNLRFLTQLFEQGRILGFEIGITLHDGAPEGESNGFVDDHDIPPIDTWFFVKPYFQHRGFGGSLGLLFCWIPKAAEKLMQNTIDVEVLDSYFWLDEAFPKIQQELEERIKKL